MSARSRNLPFPASITPTFGILMRISAQLTQCVMELCKVSVCGSLLLTVCVCLYASLSYGRENKKKRSKQVRARIGRRTRQLSKSALLALGTRENNKKKKQKTHNAIVFATKAHTYTDAHQQAWPWPENCAMWNNRGVGGLLSPPLSISLWMGQQKNTKPEHVVI